MTAVLPGGAATPARPLRAPTTAPSPPPAQTSGGGTASSTPTRLRTLQVLVAISCLALGLALIVSASTRSGQIDQAERASDLVVATQDVRSALGRADAASVNAFLAGGVDQPEQRLRYSTALEDAGVALQRAGSAAGPGPAAAPTTAAPTTAATNAAAAVSELQRLLPIYSGLIETARANNRQQLPLGAAYLRAASQLLRTEVAEQLGLLRVAGDESLREVDQDIVGGFGPIPLALVVVVLGVFVGTQRWLAVRTRRLLSPGLLGAGLVLLAGLVWVATSIGNSAQAAAAASAGGYDRLSALTAIRADAFDRQASSTFALVDRGARDSFNAAAATAAQNVEARLAVFDDRGSGLDSSWGRYLERSDAITAADEAGDAEGARDKVTAAISDPDSLSGRFEAFDEQVVVHLDIARQSLGSGLDQARSPLDRVRIVAAVMALVAAGLAAWGIQQRISDYR